MRNITATDMAEPTDRAGIAAHARSEHGRSDQAPRGGIVEAGDIALVVGAGDFGRLLARVGHRQPPVSRMKCMTGP